MAEDVASKFSEMQKNSSIIVNQTYSYINNTGFYALANPTYFNYYYRYARRYGWWYDGYVPDFHNEQQGYFSTRLAHSIVDGIANKIVGRKLLLKNVGLQKDKTIANETLKSAYAWAEDTNLTGVIRKATKYAGAMATSLIKLNCSAGGLWLEALRFDDFFFETDFRGKLQEVTCLIKSYTNTQPRTVDWIDKNSDSSFQQCFDGKYYLVEKRFFKDEKVLKDGELKTVKVPYVVYQVHKYTGNITNAQSWNVSLVETVDANSLPKAIRKAIGRDYSAIILGKPLRLPFVEYLGCELYRYNGDDGSLSQQPFGQSILADIITDLMHYDLAVSYKARDMYQGKGVIFAKKELQTALSGTSTFRGLEDSMIEWLSTISDDGKLPLEQVQFNLRATEWRDIENHIIESIATKLNISPSSLASYLSDNTGRTAREVSTEEGNTDNYIEIQRGCLETPINCILKAVGQFYGWQDTVAVRFAKSGSENMSSVVERVIRLKQAGLITPYEALKQIMIDSDEWELEEQYNKLIEYNQQEEEKQNQINFGMDFSKDTTIAG